MDMSLTTWKDLTDHVVYYLGDNSTTRDVLRSARRATIDAYRELATAHHWSYYYQRGQINSVASYSTGTVGYDQTGGAFERVVTLSDGVWPSWATLGQILIAGTIYQIAARKSDTALTLAIGSNPGSDVDAATAYTIFRDSYVLPHDFLATGRLVNTSNSLLLTYVPPDSWQRRQRVQNTPATPRVYTIRASEDHFGCMAVSFYPPPDQVYHFDFMYQRRPRPLRVHAVETGTASVTAASAAVAGSGTAWTADLAGSVFRISSTADAPTGLDGSNPAVLERVVASVQSATELTLDSVAETSYSEKKYIISDPVDIEEGAMLTALYRAVEKQNGIVRVAKNLPAAAAAYREALVMAREADSRDFSNRFAGGGGGPDFYRLRDYPSGSDVE